MSPRSQELALPDGVDVRVVTAPAEVEIGQPFALTIEVSHPDSARVEIGESPFTLDTGWIELEAEPPLALGSDLDPRTVTRFEYRLSAIEQTRIQTESGWVWSASRSVPLPELTLVEDATRTTLAVEPPALTVLGVLEVGEQEPRPLPGLAGLTEPAPWTPDLAQVLSLAAGLLVVSLSAVLGLRWLSASRPSPGGPSVREATRTLADRLSGGDFDRERVFEVARLARRAVDERLGRSLPAATDDEWLAELPREGDWMALRARMAEFFGRSTRVRYADLEPTEWAIEELVREGLELVEVCERLTPPGAEVAR